MRKFTVLLKKEIRELFTVQMLIPIVLMALIFMLLGSVIGDAMDEEHSGDGTSNMGRIVVCDKDGSTLSKESINMLREIGYHVTEENQGEISNIIEVANNINSQAVIVIPANFEENVYNGIPINIEAYSMLKNLSVTSQTGDAALQNTIFMINKYISDKLINEQLIENVNPDIIKNPVVQNSFVSVNNKIANISAMDLKSFLTTQNIFIPIVMFMIIVYSTQLLITTIASEKENKTMETLLSTPVTRSSIIGAKMLAAGFSALVFAVVYMFGFQYYMSGVMGSESAGSEQLKNAISELGIVMGIGDYILLGMSLFISILVALALASILGSMADDVKKAQGYITPVMLLVMVPYLLTMLIDVSTAEPLVKILINAIPFSHPFQASSFLFLNQYIPVVFGILYQLAVFAILLFIATKIYSSDKIFLTRH